MKKMNKKGFTLVELLAVIVILAILMAIAATNLGPVIDNSRRASMRSTAQQILSSVQSQLTSSFALYPGTYQWDKGILDSGGITAPFGGEYHYHAQGEAGTGETKYGSGVYKISSSTSLGSCSKTSTSYIVITRTGEGNYRYVICLSTTGEGGTGEGNSYLYGTREDVDKKGNNIFCGDASQGIDGACVAPSDWPTTE